MGRSASERSTELPNFKTSTTNIRHLRCKALIDHRACGIGRRDRLRFALAEFITRPQAEDQIGAIKWYRYICRASMKTLSSVSTATLNSRDWHRRGDWICRSALP